METTELQRTLREGRYRRIAAEIAEIREAARLMTEQDGAFLAASAEFLTVQARLLHGENEHCTGEALPWGKDTTEDPDTLPTPARSALLMARAYLAG
ncbi:hypothetical protein [Kitasatospora sp. NPDC057223]|uniref:hypothetical protein n=1 Tax=Kitasatospora sp. NPDC057223 TaxID=3346055 RepID=UPI00363F9C0B